MATKPLLARLKKLGGAALPASTNLEGLLGGLRNTGGLERLLDFIFLGTGAANGYDSLGHFLRTEGLGTICTEYKTAPTSSCSRKLFSTGSSSGRPHPRPRPRRRRRRRRASRPASTRPPRALVMARTLAVIKGDTPEQAIAEYPGEEEGSKAATKAVSPRGRVLGVQGSRARGAGGLDHAEERRRGLREGSPGGTAAAQLPARR